jgi:hypothetical protein
MSGETTERAGALATLPNRTGMITSSPRAAVAGALLAVAAGLIAPNNLLAFYITALAAAVLMFAAFLAYLAAAEHLDRRSGLAVSSTGLAAALVMTDAAVRFPALLDPRAPGGAGVMAVVALLVVLAGLAGELPRLPLDTAALRQRLRPVREMLSR